MQFRFYVDPATGMPRIHNHNVSEDEAIEVLEDPGEDRPGREGARVALGQTLAGRYLRVIYVPDRAHDDTFVITAYDLVGKPLVCISQAKKEKAVMSRTRFPAGWDETKVQRVLSHYEKQTEEDALSEDEVGARFSKGVAGGRRPTKRAAGRVFISHSSKDRVFAELVSAELRKVHFDPWIDSENVLAGDDIFEKIGDALKTMDLLLFFVSREALKSDWVDRELKFASKRWIKDKQTGILPFVIDDTPFSDLPWYIDCLHAHRVAANAKGAKEVCAQVKEVLEKRILPLQGRSPLKGEFQNDARLDAFIEPIKLGDWRTAELVALEIVKTTDASGRNSLFETLLKYQDLKDDDLRLWGALHTIECCVRLAPWLIDHGMISRMADHENFSVRSSAAAICLDLAHVAPDRVPLDLVIKLSSYSEDWYVETPANSALKAMARSCPAVLRLFFQRLRSDSVEERAHTAYAIWDIASKEPEILNVEELQDAAAHLRTIGDSDAYNRIVAALSKAKTVRRKPRYVYGF